MRRLKKILIVDDDQELVRTWRNAFSLEGVESDAAYSGQEALSVLRGKGPGYYQAALLDIWMETPTAGLDVFPEITRTDQNLPVIFVSTHVTEEWLSKMVLQGAALMVPKPVPFEVVFQTVLSAAIRRDLEQENWRAHEDQVRSEEKAKREQQLRFYIQLITHHVKNLAFGAKARLHAAMEEMKEKDLKEQLDVVKTLLDTISKQVGRILVMHKVSGDERDQSWTLMLLFKAVRKNCKIGGTISAERPTRRVGRSGRSSSIISNSMPDSIAST